MLFTCLRWRQSKYPVMMLFVGLVGSLCSSQVVNAGRSVRNSAAQTAAEPAIVSPREGKLIKGRSVRICARGLGTRFSVLAGNRDVTRVSISVEKFPPVLLG